MNKLQKFLEKNAEKVEYSVSSYSRYYTINGVLVRYSDHIRTSSGHPIDINIVAPANQPKSFIVCTTTLGAAYVFNATKTINFIVNSLAFINLTRTKTDLTTTSKNPTIIEQKVVEGNAYITMEGVTFDKFINLAKQINGNALGVSKTFYATFKCKFPKTCSTIILKDALLWASDNQGANQTKISEFIRTL